MADFAAFCRKPPSIENCRVYSYDKSKGAYQFSGNNANPGDFLGIDRPARFWTSSELEIDGRWHRRPLRTTGILMKRKPFPPGRQYNNIAVDVDQWWEMADSQNPGRVGQAEPERLKLTAGKHTIRVAPTMPVSGNHPGDYVRVISNPVEIEIVAEHGEKDGAIPEGNADLKSVERWRNLSAGLHAHSTDAKHEVRMGMPSMAQSVAGSSAIIRARFLEKTDTGRHQGDLILSKWKMDVIKVIYGKVSGQTIEVMCWQDPEFQEEGREVIMCLRMIEGQIYRTTTYYGSLDSREKAILEVIESGAHLTAPTVGTRW